MADIEGIVSEIVAGLVDNCRVNAVTMAEGPDAELAIDLYYMDSDNEDNIALQAKYGVPDDEEYATIKQRIEAFIAAN